MKDMGEGSVARDPVSVLKRLREAKGWTLAEVKERTGLPISTLSKLENGKMGLSYDKLMKLSHGLGVDIAELIGGGPTSDRKSPPIVSGRRVITRSGEEHVIKTPRYDYVCPAAELLNRSMHPMLIDINIRSIDDYGELSRHEGEEFTYVVEGSVEFHSDLYAPAVLNQGDSIYFDAGMGHAYIAASAGPCRIFSVSTNIPDDE